MRLSAMSLIPMKPRISSTLLQSSPERRWPRLSLCILPRLTSSLTLRGNVWAAVELALDYAHAGLFDESIALLRERVTSKGGTTERALASMRKDGVLEAILRAVRAANERSKELGAELGRDA